MSLEPFVAVCALKLHARERDGGAQRREVDEAFALFTTATLPGSGGADKGGKGKGKALDSLIADDDDVQEVQGPDQGAKITFAHLKRVAAILKLDDPAAADGGITVTDDLLRDMILEANGGAGVSRGVSRDEFEEVMRRAGVWR